MPSPKVSIIIPVYNVSKYLEKCLYSAEKQTLKDIEIIIINDCSPDPLDDAICQKHANNDSRITYVKHSENLGIGGARNTGIKLASARYIGFIDADDFIDSRLFETCYTEAIKDDNDVVIFGFVSIDENGALSTPIIPAGDTEGDLFYNFLEIKNTMNPSSWNKLWKKSLFVDNNIKFPLHVFNEDVSTIPRILYFAENIKFLDQVFYYYLTRGSAVTQTISKKHIDSALKSLSILNDFTHSIKKSSFYHESVQKRFWSIIEYFFQNGLGSAPEATKEEMLSYIRDSVVTNPLVDIRLFLSRKNYIECDILFAGLPSYIDATLDILDLVKIKKLRDEIRESRDEITVKYEYIKTDHWYRFGQLSNSEKLKFVPGYLVKRVQNFGARLSKKYGVGSRRSI